MSANGDGGVARAGYRLESVLCTNTLRILRWQEYASVLTDLV